MHGIWRTVLLAVLCVVLLGAGSFQPFGKIFGLCSQ